VLTKKSAPPSSLHLPPPPSISLHHPLHLLVSSLPQRRGCLRWARRGSGRR
jgi:hypothetical protein